MQFDFNLSANGGMNIETAGRFVKYVRGTGKIRVRFDKGGYIDLLPGQGCTGLDFSRLTVEDRSGALNAGVLLAGAFMFQDDRISGTVDVVDGGRTRTLAGQAFYGSVGIASAAGNNGHVGLLNPGASGLRVTVSGFLVTLTADGYVNVSGMANVLTTLAGYGKNKKVGGADSVSQLRYESVPSTYYQTNPPMVCLFAKAGVLVPQVFKEPIVLEPGQGLLMYTGTGANMNTSFEYLEELL